MKQVEFFGIVPTDESNEKFTIIIGDGRATKMEFDSEEEAQKYIHEKPWEMIASTATFIATKIVEENEKKNIKIKNDAKQVVNNIIQ